ncbi:Tryptophan--tRNA ligase, mitochondrial [Entomophthora muscae]|uniref:Tryptophan--tRNA ligase, mitochondrial n=1 Tax=Entomophthora muscae TaxID=34485 RepID=A0ACC2TBY4_9FUNG|nr:Tryptophan--tRNA ligase, mitochondrial [Entomophthora muscae]
MTASLLALGVDPSKVVLFRQSAVPEHTQMAWHLSCISSYAELEQLPCWRHKQVHNPDGHIELSALTYSILQAADVLLYRATHVPIGIDQWPNLKHARLLSHQFNERTDTDLLRAPQAIYTSSPCVYSLSNPGVKMSKSNPLPRSLIRLTDSPESISNFIRRALTDSIDGISYSPNERPGTSNLLQLMGLLTGHNPFEVAKQYRDKQISALKTDLAKALSLHLQPFQESFATLRRNEDYLRIVLLQGAEKARQEASSTLGAFQSQLGLAYPLRPI